MILLDVSVVATGAEVGEKLGAPEPYKARAGSASAPPSNQPSNNMPAQRPANNAPVNQQGM